MILVFLTTSTVNNYLGKIDYGIWAAIYSFISWVYLLDFGFTNVIKTKLPIHILEKDGKKTNELISTIYVGVGIIAATIIGVFLLINTFYSPSEFFNIKASSVNFNLLLLVNLLFSVFILVVGSHKSLFVGVLKTHLVEFSLMMIQLLIYISITSVSRFDLFPNNPKILTVSMVYGLVNITVGIIFTVYFFKKHKDIKISLKYFNLAVLKENTTLGMRFFLIQVCMIVIYSTDHLLILKYFGSKEVGEFDIVLKLFQVPMLLLTAGLSPFWSIFSKAYAEKKYLWIKKIFYIYNLSFILFILGIVVLNYLINDIIFLWIHSHIAIPNLLLIAVSVYITMISYAAIYQFFLNGLNNIKLSMSVIIFQAIVNIPVCIFLIKCGYGIPGVVIGNCLCILPATIATPVQSFFIINKRIKETI
jgi:O-antigen/teichoic acid export membrane protein